MKNILKLIFASLFVSAILIACDNEADRDWKTTEASFRLIDAGLGANIITDETKDNPFTVIWDVKDPGEYSVVLSTTQDFESKIVLGTSSTNSFTTTLGDLNTKLLDAGFAGNTAHSLFLRVEMGDEVSNAVATTITTYQAVYPDFYLVGAASNAGWDAVNSINFYKHDNISEIYTYLQPDEFRFLGQADWNPLNYSIDAAGIKDSYKYFKTVSPNIEKSSGDENMKFTGAAGMYKVMINVDTKSLTAEPSSIPTWDVPNLYIVGTINGWSADTAYPLSPLGNGKFEYIGELADASEFKFIGQLSWGDLEWGNISGAGDTGFLAPKGGNIKFNGGGGFFKIIVDIKTGKYTVSPL